MLTENAKTIKFPLFVELTIPFPPNYVQSLLKTLIETLYVELQDQWNGFILLKKSVKMTQVRTPWARFGGDTQGSDSPDLVLDPHLHLCQVSLLQKAQHV